MSDVTSERPWRYYCADCGTVHREPDGECVYECTGEMFGVSEDALRVLPHAFSEQVYSPLCGDCRGRRDEHVHYLPRLASGPPASPSEENR
jgi:hypothetical protein